MKKIPWGIQKNCSVQLALLFALGATSCLPQAKVGNGTVSTTTNTPTASVAAPTGEMAVRIEFKQVNGTFTSGSFPTTGPTGPTLAATTLYRPDGSVIATGPSGWPGWLTSFEISISDAVNNPNSKNADCARFSTAADANAQCDFKRSGLPADRVFCGAPTGFYRVSDYDCYTPAQGTEVPASGRSDDGVQLRAVFNRSTSVLGASENIMVVIEYSAAALNPPSRTPANCFTLGVFTPEKCNDLLWQSYLKTSPVQTNASPFLMLAPPALGHVDPVQGSGGSGVGTRQFILPLASNTALTTFQISRLLSTTLPGADAATFAATCNFPIGGGSSNAALCVGMVFYSITFYRI